MEQISRCHFALIQYCVTRTKRLSYSASRLGPTRASSDDGHGRMVPRYLCVAGHVRWYLPTRICRYNTSAACMRYRDCSIIGKFHEVQSMDWTANFKNLRAWTAGWEIPFVHSHLDQSQRPRHPVSRSRRLTAISMQAGG